MPFKEHRTSVASHATKKEGPSGTPFLGRDESRIYRFTTNGFVTMLMSVVTRTKYMPSAKPETLI